MQAVILLYSLRSYKQAGFKKLSWSVPKYCCADLRDNWIKCFLMLGLVGEPLEEVVGMGRLSARSGTLSCTCV